MTDTELDLIRRAAYTSAANGTSDLCRLVDEVYRLRAALARIEALDCTVHGLVLGNIAREALGIQ